MMPKDKQTRLSANDVLKKVDALIKALIEDIEGREGEGSTNPLLKELKNKLKEV